MSTHSYCFLCKSNIDLEDVPFTARIQVFVQRRIFIPARNRCCRKHVINNRFYNDEVDEITVYSNESLINITEVEAFMEKLSDESVSELHNRIGKLTLSDERIKILTRYVWD